MKASNELRGKVTALVAPLDTRERRELYNQGDYPRAGRTKDIDKRYRWDLLWSAAAIDRSIYDDLSREGLLDTHTDTMLRAIVQPLAPVAT